MIDSETVLKQLVKELKEMKQGISQMSQTMATKEDLRRIRHTMKDDIANIHPTMATKENVQQVEQSIAKLSETHKDGVIALIDKLDHGIREVSSHVNQLSIIQDRQHRVIELLSARSVEHEAKLKRKQ